MIDISIKKLVKCLSIFILIFSAFYVNASQSVGTISDDYYMAQICEKPNCPISQTSSIYFNKNKSSLTEVSVHDDYLSGYIHGESLGDVALNCIDTKIGCDKSKTRGDFKVANNREGTLSGFAWGENSGWINFGPFMNSKTNQVVIGADGAWNGYAWSENFGWIKFDCSKKDYCVKTDWHPLSVREKIEPKVAIAIPLPKIPIPEVKPPAPVITSKDFEPSLDDDKEFVQTEYLSTITQNFSNLLNKTSLRASALLADTNYFLDKAVSKFKNINIPTFDTSLFDKMYANASIGFESIKDGAVESSQSAFSAIGEVVTGAVTNIQNSFKYRGDYTVNHFKSQPVSSINSPSSADQTLTYSDPVFDSPDLINQNFDLIKSYTKDYIKMPK